MDSQKMSACTPAVSVIVAGVHGIDASEELIDRLANQTLDALQIVYATSDRDCAAALQNEYDDMQSLVTIATAANDQYASCFNAGLALATGAYVLFLNDDVQLENNVLQAAYKKASKLGADMVLINENHHVDRPNRYIGSFKQLRTELFQNNECFSREDLRGRLFLVASGAIQSKLIRRELLTRSGVSFDECDSQGAAQMSYVCMALADKICGLDRCLVHLPESYAYRTGYSDVASFYDNLYRKLKEHGVCSSVEKGLIDLFLEDVVYECLARGGESQEDRLCSSIVASSFYREVVERRVFDEEAILDPYKARLFKYCMGETSASVKKPMAQASEDGAKAYDEECIIVVDVNPSSCEQAFEDVGVVDTRKRSLEWQKMYAFPTDEESRAYDEYALHVLMDEPCKGSLARWRPFSMLYQLNPHGTGCLHVVFFVCRANRSLVDLEPIAWIRTMHAQSIRTYVVLTESVGAIFGEDQETAKEFLRHFDYVASIDPVDAQEHGFVYSLLPYTANHAYGSDASGCDLYFCGEAGNYEQELLSIACNAHEAGLGVDMNIAHMRTRGERIRGVHRLDTGCRNSSRGIGCARATCLLDVSGSDNIIPRAFYDAVVHDKKLLSNNPSIKNAPFYDPRYMHVFADVNEIDYAWVAETVPITYGYAREFSAGVVLDALIDECRDELSRFVPKDDPQPLVSVVLPTYNRANTILRAVQSVLAQTYSNLELIVVDDGSSDNTVDVLETIEDARLKVIRTTNRGACAARNTGVEHATGELVAFQDSDDEWLPSKLQIQVEALREHPGACVVFCNALRIEEDNELGMRPLVPMRMSSYMAKRDMQTRSLASTQTLLMRRECLNAEQFDENLRRLQDFDLVFRLSERYAFYYVSVPLVYMYVQKDSISTDPQKAIEARWYMMDKYREVMELDAMVYEGMLGSIHNNSVMLEREDASVRQNLRYVRQLKKERGRSSDLASSVVKLKRKVVVLGERVDKQCEAIAKRDKKIARQAKKITRQSDKLARQEETIAQLRKDLDKTQSSIAHRISRRLKRS